MHSKPQYVADYHFCTILGGESCAWYINQELIDHIKFNPCAEAASLVLACGYATSTLHTRRRSYPGISSEGKKVHVRS